MDCTCVFKHTDNAGEDNSGNVTVAIQLEERERQELDCVFSFCFVFSQQKDGQGSTFSVRSIFKRRSDGLQRRNKSACGIVAMRKDTSVQETETELQWALSSEDPMNARRRLHQSIYKIFAPRKLGDVLENQRLLQGLSPGQESALIIGWCW